MIHFDEYKYTNVTIIFYSFWWFSWMLGTEINLEKYFHPRLYVLKYEIITFYCIKSYDKNHNEI